MSKAKSISSIGLEQQIEFMIVEFLETIAPEDLNGDLPDDHREIEDWFFSNHEWWEGEEQRSQRIVMLREDAVSYFRLKEAIYALITKSKPKQQSYSRNLASEKSVNDVVRLCVSQFVWHSINNSATGVNQIVKKTLKETLFSTPQRFYVLMPVYGLFTNSEITFRSGLYSRPADRPEYVEQIAQIKLHSRLVLLLPDSEELNTGSDVIVRVECLARFQDEAIDIARALITNDLAILAYASRRQFRGDSRFMLPGIVNREHKRASIASMVYDKLGKATIHPRGFSQVLSSQLDMQDWNSSMWSEVLSNAESICLTNPLAVASNVLDAMTWLGRATDLDDEATRLLYQITALETLLPLDGKEEKVHQVSLLTTVLGGMAGVPRRGTYELIRRAYSIRSEVVHGSRMSTSKYEPDRVGRLLDQILDFLLFKDEGVQMLGIPADEFRMMLLEKLFV